MCFLFFDMVAFTQFLKRTAICQKQFEKQYGAYICDSEIEEGGNLWKGGTIWDTLPLGRMNISTIRLPYSPKSSLI